MRRHVGGRVGQGAIVTTTLKAEEAKIPFALASAPAGVMQIFYMVDMQTRVHVFGEVQHAVDHLVDLIELRDEYGGGDIQSS